MAWQGQLRSWSSSARLPPACSVAMTGVGAGVPRWGSVEVSAAHGLIHPSLRLDTSFMYMIAGLCMLKLYQKRHPDINASAYSAYACLAIVIFFSVLGVVRPWPTLLTRRTGARVCTHSHPPPPLPERPLLPP